jgi:DNA-directed RNA polymerase specialized sigma24 family protein
MEFSAEAIENFRRKLLYKLRYHLGSFCPDVEDLAQDTLARFLECSREGKIRNEDRIGAFLSGICNNVMHEYRRRLWREIAYDPDLHGNRSVPPEAERVDMQDAILAGLLQLSARDRTVLREFLLDERSKEVICRELGLTDPQFRLVLFRAKERFRQIYTGGLKQLSARRHQ